MEKFFCLNNELLLEQDNSALGIASLVKLAKMSDWCAGLLSIERLKLFADE